MDVSEINYELQSEGQKILEMTFLLGVCAELGEVDVGGSYRYGTMVDRDIDIAILVDDITFNNRQSFVDVLVKIPAVESFSFVDRLKFPKPGTPSGYWAGLKIPYESNYWNIDVWYVYKNEPLTHSNLELHNRMLKASDAQKKLILEIKNQLLIDELKNKGQSSADVYQCVLDGKVSSAQDYYKQKGLKQELITNQDGNA